jgi:retron-type reverse transcriptase
MERMTLNRIIHKMGPLNKRLYAYRKNIGTQDAISAFIHTITKDTKETKIACMIDLEKAFEMINKNVVLEKLVKNGIKGNTLAWIKDFLSHRKAKVKFQGETSDTMEMENGTPQGSVLSAILFNLVMDELLVILGIENTDDIQIFCYADDIVILSSHIIPSTALKNMQDILNNLEKAAEVLGLVISKTKTKSMIFKKKIQKQI